MNSFFESRWFHLNLETAKLRTVVITVLLKKMKRHWDIRRSIRGREEHNVLPVLICSHHCFSGLFCFHPHPGSGSLDSLPTSSSITTPHGYMGFVVPTGCPRYVLRTGTFQSNGQTLSTKQWPYQPPHLHPLAPTTAHEEDEDWDASWSINCLLVWIPLCHNRSMQRLKSLWGLHRPVCHTHPTLPSREEHPGILDHPSFWVAGIALHPRSFPCAHSVLKVTVWFIEHLLQYKTVYRCFRESQRETVAVKASLNRKSPWAGPGSYEESLLLMDKWFNEDEKGRQVKK